MVFHGLTFAVARGSSLKLLPRDTANVNALKLTCVIAILAFFQ